MPFKIPTSRELREKNSAIEFGEKRGSETQGRGYVRTGNPDSASGVSSGTFLGVL